MPRPFVAITRRGEPLSIPIVSRVRALVNRTALRTDAVVKGTLHEVAARLIERTPVLTGTMVSNWRASVDAPDDRFDKANPDPGRTETLARIDAVLAVLRAGDRVFLNNPTPYLPYHEYGTRWLPPKAFVRNTISEVPGIIRAEKAKARLLDAPPESQGLLRTLFRG